MEVAVLDVGGDEYGGNYFLNYKDYRRIMMLDWMEHNIHFLFHQVSTAVDVPTIFTIKNKMERTVHAVRERCEADC